MRRTVRFGGLAFVALSGTLLMLVGTPVVASATTSPPTVLSFSLSRTSLAYTGGNIVADVRVKGASTCRLTSIPGFRLPAKFTCRTGSYAKTITIPRDNGGTPEDYSIGMTVANSAGTVFATAVVVSVGGAPPPISMSPAVLSFGGQGVGIQSAPTLVTITNNARTPQQITGIGVDYGYDDYSDFGVLNNSCTTITPGNTCTFDVDFTPSGSGGRSAVIEITDGTFDNVARYTVEGTGEFSSVLLSATGLTGTSSGSALSFGTVGVDTGGEAENLTLENSSATVPLSIGTITTVGTNTQDFDVTNAGNCQNLIIGPSQTCTISITFNPTSSGARTTDIVIYDNAKNFETFVTLKGTGEYAQTVFTVGSTTTTPGQIVQDNVGSSPEGTEAGPFAITVKNASASVAVFFGAGTMKGTNPGNFILSDNACINNGLMLNPGASCTFDVSFIPTVVGSSTATLYLDDNTTPGYDQIDFSGTGT